MRSSPTNRGSHRRARSRSTARGSADRWASRGSARFRRRSTSAGIGGCGPRTARRPESRKYETTSYAATNWRGLGLSSASDLEWMARAERLRVIDEQVHRRVDASRGVGVLAATRANRRGLPGGNESNHVLVVLAGGVLSSRSTANWDSDGLAEVEDVGVGELVAQHDDRDGIGLAAGLRLVLLLLSLSFLSFLPSADAVRVGLGLSIRTRLG